MSQKQIKIIPLKLLDNKLFKFLILSFKISIDNNGSVALLSHNTLK